LIGNPYRTPFDLKMSRFKKRLRVVGLGCAISVQKKSSTENRGKTSQRKESRLYPSGDSAGVSSVPAGDSVVTAGTSGEAGLVISVAAGGGVVGVGLVAGVTVSVFCSHAARSAAPARMQMYFFIVGDAHCFNTSIAASAVFGARRMLLETQMARHER
jgi:hypothetical protein